MFEFFLGIVNLEQTERVASGPNITKPINGEIAHSAIVTARQRNRHAMEFTGAVI